MCVGFAKPMFTAPIEQNQEWLFVKKEKISRNKVKIMMS